MSDNVGKPVTVTSVIDGVAKTTQLEMTNSISKRRLMRQPKNPLDKCTIVSIFPKDIHEDKITIEPGKFIIPAGSLEKPSVLTIGSSSWWKDYDPEQPIMEMINSSIQVAESIVNDYCNGMLGCNMSDCMPGLFYVIGEHTSLEVKLKYKKKLEEVDARQTNWYRVLVRLADSLWTRTNGNPIAIWDEMKLAARALNLNDKLWLKDQQMSEMVRCFACGNMRNPSYPICPTCKVVDQSHPAAKDLKFAL